MYKPLLLASFIVLLTSCSVPSTVALNGRAGRNAFNTTLQTTTNEQLLLNVVRLRYCDAPYFLNVQNITNTVTFEANGRALFNFPGFNEKNPAEVTGGIGWKSSPTIVYAPVDGRQFSELLLQPIDLRFLQQLIYSGWDVDRVFRIAVQNFDNLCNAPTASGPYPRYDLSHENFFRVTRLLRHFQERNQLHVGVKVEGEKDVETCRSLQIYFPQNGSESKELAKLLGDISPYGEGYYIVDVSLGFQQKGEVGIMPRSVLSCMYYLSLGVDIPLEHEAKKTGLTTMCDSDCEFDRQSFVQDLMHIRHSKSHPKHAHIATYYKGYWFYIDESDLASKRSFLLLMNLYNLQAGVNKGRMPVLTIPITKG